VIHEMNSEEWECGDDGLALNCVFVTILYAIIYWDGVPGWHVCVPMDEHGLP
jgi:hypothetical protein